MYEQRSNSSVSTGAMRMHCTAYSQHAGERYTVISNSSKLDEPVVEAFTDADFANAEDMVSVISSLVRIYGNPVCWIAKRHNKVARNTSEAELSQ